MDPCRNKMCAHVGKNSAANDQCLLPALVVAVLSAVVTGNLAVGAKSLEWLCRSLEVLLLPQPPLSSCSEALYTIFFSWLSLSIAQGGKVGIDKLPKSQFWETPYQGTMFTVM